ncbi:hypothetical protein [Luteimicrobium subarcticum]|uniref:Uncharacterized protein n=1 Tax=Luteimicrobium subarcticum TaxID=620910 RepID=A0A2M8W704_9MICO|nr:hypothetical protein [Luteimicrobium subarcticum]PJI86706.1 hypothetical protein CLV34_2626 [Luteimicrobium subarcticum]
MSTASGRDVERDQLRDQLEVIRDAGWTADEVKAGSLHLAEWGGALELDRAQPGDRTYADLAREAGLEP